MNSLCLSRAAAALDDPIVLDWAVHYYSDLPPHSERRAQLAAEWFPGAALERWIEAGDFDTLSILLRELPEAHWSALATTMAARWNEWPSRMASASAKILARVAPDLATQAFDQYLESPPPWSIDRVVAILDSLDRALEQASELSARNNFEAFHQGLELIHTQILGCLERHGVAKIAARGEEFDPEKHQALMQVETPGMESNRVVDEYESGYTLHGRLLRPSKVSVSKNVSRDTEGQ